MNPGNELDRTLQQLPQPTRQAVVHEAAAAAAGCWTSSWDITATLAI
jgi:hypothetical protein